MAIMWNPFRRKKKAQRIRPLLGSRELVELLGAEVEEKRIERSAAMAAYQRNLRGN